IPLNKKEWSLSESGRKIHSSYTHLLVPVIRQERRNVSKRSVEAALWNFYPSKTYSQKRVGSKWRREIMETVAWLFIIVGTILLFVMTSPYFSWWGQSLIVIYYGSLSFLFIGMTRRINEKYSNVIPVPDAYWDENSQWAETASHLILLPF